MNIIVEHILFFLVGFFQDILITLYYKEISNKRPGRSAWLSGIITVVNLTVFYGILSRLDQTVYSRIVVYALGNAVGTYLVVRHHPTTPPV